MPHNEKFVPFTMANPRPVIHIDREEIYTNLEARMHYLQSFLDFTSRMSYHNPSPSQKLEIIKNVDMNLQGMSALS
jgi:hypothetical protein